MRSLLIGLYALWCVMIVLGYATAQRGGYSPFASGGRTGFFYAAGGGGPRHK